MAKIPNGAYSTTQYARNLSEYQAKEDALTYWENLLQPATAQYQANITAANTQKSYDITNAYQNYLNYETQLRNSNLLGTSQNKLSTQAKSAYDTSYSKALSDYYKNVESSTADYNKAITAAQEDIYKEAETVKAIDEQIKSYISDNYKTMGYTDDDIKNMFKRLPTGEMELTELGKNIYANVLDSIYTADENSDYYGKNVFLTDLSSNAKLYDYAVENQEKLRKVLAGYTQSDYDYKQYTPDKYDYSLNVSKSDPEWAEKTYNLTTLGKIGKDVNSPGTFFGDINNIDVTSNDESKLNSKYTYKIGNTHDITWKLLNQNPTINGVPASYLRTLEDGTIFSIGDKLYTKNGNTVTELVKDKEKEKVKWL